MNQLYKIAGTFKRVKRIGVLLLIVFIQMECSHKADTNVPQSSKDSFTQRTDNQVHQSADNGVTEKRNSKVPKTTKQQDQVNKKASKQVKDLQTTKNQVRDLGNGFRDYGVAVPYATSRGTVATIDDQGNHIIMIWLYDHRGTYSLLMIDTDQKKSNQFFLPFSDDSFTSLLSSQNRYYTQFGGQFVEFDPNKKAFTFIGETSAGTALSMTEDDNGIIWAALKPNCNLISYNPETGKLTDYGVIHSQKARQKPRSIATDDNGWVYVTAGTPGKEKIIAFNSKARKAHIIQKKAAGDISLYRAKNGKVAGTVNKNVKMELYAGESSDLKPKNKMSPKLYITGDQSLFHRTFSDGRRVVDYISAASIGFLFDRKVTIEDPETGKSRKVAFDYKTEGSNIMGVAAGPDGTIVGGTNFPMVFFQYDPNSDRWTRRGAYGQFNTLATQGEKLFIGSYPRGDLLEWDPGQKWVPTREGKKGTNPQYLAKGYPYIARPHDLLAYPDGKTIILAGRPSGKLNEGGLLFWDMKTRTADLLKHIDALPNQSTQNLVALPNGKILGGTTNKPGESGGIRKAKEAELYIMDLKSQKIEWSDAVISGAQSYQDLCVAPNGFVMGVAGLDQFFVFDPKKHKVVHRLNLQKVFGSGIPYTQGQRSFVKGPERKIYLLLQKGILQINPNSFKMTLLAKAPTTINGGGAYLNGRIYYISGKRTRMNSYRLSN